VTGVLTVYDFAVDQAVIATWDDGAVLDAFLVRSTWLPHVDLLQRDLEAALAKPRSSEALPDAEVTFDDDASPWYTRCDVRAPDRPGLFHALAVAISGADADVHGARATTRSGRVHDRFDLTDLTGEKLGPVTKARIEALVRSGTASSDARVV
jgi:UTP:GlnB (protein PII) uridylyltransferase